MVPVLRAMAIHTQYNMEGPLEARRRGKKEKQEEKREEEGMGERGKREGK